MIVSSTEFQQRVGYYLSLVEQGIEVVVEKKKPGRKLFLVSMNIALDKKEPTKHEKFLREFINVRWRDTDEDCVAFQRRVRQ